MGTIFRLLLGMKVLSPLLKPMMRFLAGVVAIPIFRFLLRRVLRVQELNAELEKDLEQWFRGSLLLLVASANLEEFLFGWVPLEIREDTCFGVGLRLLLAIGVIGAMPDQELFAIIHPGPPKLKFPQGRRWQALKEQAWPLIRGVLCLHLNRSSPVFAIMTAIYPGRVGWVCYFLASVQYLIIGLVTSRDRAHDILSEFDRQVSRKREELLGGLTDVMDDIHPQTAEPAPERVAGELGDRPPVSAPRQPAAAPTQSVPVER